MKKKSSQHIPCQTKVITTSSPPKNKIAHNTLLLALIYMFLSCRDLVLIDGVESDETLKNVRAGLPYDCKIIVTTRHAMVASSYDGRTGDMRHDMVALGENLLYTKNTIHMSKIEPPC
jgi:hypothetical protein